jgi:uncharacterized protein YjiS (DUF1127 family)
MASPMLSSKSLVIVAVLVRALAANTNAAVAFVRAAWKARRHRREVGRLLALDDHGLRDIGLTRADVLLSLAGPAFADPSTRLRILAVERRASRRAGLREWKAATDEVAPKSEPMPQSA